MRSRGAERPSHGPLSLDDITLTSNDDTSNLGLVDPALLRLPPISEIVQKLDFLFSSFIYAEKIFETFK